MVGELERLREAAGAWRNSLRGEALDDTLRAVIKWSAAGFPGDEPGVCEWESNGDACPAWKRGCDGKWTPNAPEQRCPHCGGRVEVRE